MIYIHKCAGLQGFEMMAIAGVGNNLITYVLNEMHFSLSKSANIVTNFIGTVFLLSLLGGYLSDSYLGSFWTMIIFGFVELSVSSPVPSFFFFFLILRLYGGVMISSTTYTCVCIYGGVYIYIQDSLSLPKSKFILLNEKKKILSYFTNTKSIKIQK